MWQNADILKILVHFADDVIQTDDLPRAVIGIVKFTTSRFTLLQPLCVLDGDGIYYW